MASLLSGKCVDRPFGIDSTTSLAATLGSDRPSADQAGKKIALRTLDTASLKFGEDLRVRPTIVSIGSPTAPCLYRSAMQDARAPCFVVSLTPSLCYLNFARAEGLQAAMSFQSGPLQMAIKGLVGEARYSAFLEDVCLFLEGDYGNAPPKRVVDALYAKVRAFVETLMERLSEAGAERAVADAVAALEAKQKVERLLSFEENALLLRDDNMFLTLFLDQLGCDAGQVAPIYDGTLVWFVAGNFLLLEPCASDDQGQVAPGLTEYKHESIASLLAAAATPQSLFATRSTYLYADALEVVFRRRPLDCTLKEFCKLAQSEAGTVSEARPSFLTHEVFVRDTANKNVIFEALLSTLPANGGSGSVKLRSLLHSGAKECLLCIHSGVYGLADKRLMTPAYYRVSDVREDMELQCGPMSGFFDKRAHSCLVFSCGRCCAPYTDEPEKECKVGFASPN